MWQWKNFENRPVFYKVMCRLRWLTFLAHPVMLTAGWTLYRYFSYRNVRHHQICTIIAQLSHCTKIIIIVDWNCNENTNKKTEVDIQLWHYSHTTCMYINCYFHQVAAATQTNINNWQQTVLRQTNTKYSTTKTVTREQRHIYKCEQGGGQMHIFKNVQILTWN